jgi:hypothetical protein
LLLSVGRTAIAFDSSTLLAVIRVARPGPHVSSGLLAVIFGRRGLRADSG